MHSSGYDAAQRPPPGGRGGGGGAPLRHVPENPSTGCNSSPGFGITGLAGTLTRPDGLREDVPTERSNYTIFYEIVADSILDGAPVPVDPADARTGLMLIDLARRAAAEGRLLPVPAASSPAAQAPAGSPTCWS